MVNIQLNESESIHGRSLRLIKEHFENLSDEEFLQDYESVKDNSQNKVFYQDGYISFEYDDRIIPTNEDLDNMNKFD